MLMERIPLIVGRDRGGLDFRGHGRFIGERGLLWAILERAVNDALGYHGGLYLSRASKRLVKCRALQWLGLAPGEFWMPEFQPFSFFWICAELNLCHKKVWRVVRKAQKNNLH